MAAPAFESLDFDAFHRLELPRRLAAGNAALAARDRAPTGSLAFRLPEGSAYTYVPSDAGVEVVDGDADAVTVVEIERGDWQGLVHDLESAPGLLYSQRVRVRRGDALRFVRWEPRLRAMFQGRPIFEPEASVLLDRAGAPLDPEQRFQSGELAKRADEMAWFLREAGFLVVRDVFSPDEVAGLLAETEQLRARAKEGDRKSWWARDAAGRSMLCRVTHAGDQPGLGSLPHDPRLVGLAALSDADLVPPARAHAEGVSVLWKRPDIADGLSDLPWHRDCGMGGHAVMCPTLICTVNLRPGSPESGELRVLPGSWRGSVPFAEATDPHAPSGIGLRVGAGDVSLHYGDIMHAAPPPGRAEGPFRVSALVAFKPRGARPHGGVRHYNDALLSRDDGQVEHLAKVAGRYGDDSDS